MALPDGQLVHRWTNDRRRVDDPPQLQRCCLIAASICRGLGRKGAPFFFFGIIRRGLCGDETLFLNKSSAGQGRTGQMFGRFDTGQVLGLFPDGIPGSQFARLGKHDVTRHQGHAERAVSKAGGGAALVPRTKKRKGGTGSVPEHRRADSGAG